MENLEAIADRLADSGKGIGDSGIQIGPGGLISAVENLVDHGDHPFLFLSSAVTAC
jgi:hypothetical protein